MRKIFTVFLAAVLSTTVFAQDNYNVIKVNGTIVVNKNNEVLKRGSSFEANDELNFKSSNARAAVINPDKGRYILMPNNKNIAYARANLTPSMSNISTRSGAMLNKVDLENYFCGEFVIIDKIYIKISDEIFKMNNKNFFYISYRYKDEDINKKLTYSNDTLIIDRSELFTIDGWPITNPNISNMELFYFNGENKSVKQRINNFNPIIPDPDELINEINVILESLSDKSKENIIKQTSIYINEMYGKIDQSNVEKWLNKKGII